MNSKKNICKVVLIGDHSVGKSSIFYKYANKIYDKPNIHTEFYTKDFITTDDNQSITLQVWDIVGREMYLSSVSMSRLFYRHSNCCVLCFDVCNEKSFVNIETWKNQFLEHVKDIRYGIETPFVVIGNKTDLNEKRVIDEQRAITWCQENGNIPYFETSAKDNINITNAFNTIGNLAYKHYKNSGGYPYNNIVILPPEYPKVGTCC